MKKKITLAALAAISAIFTAVFAFRRRKYIKCC